MERLCLIIRLRELPRQKCSEYLESLKYPKEVTNGARRIIEDYETSGQWHFAEEGKMYKHQE